MPAISEVKAYLSRFGLQVMEYEQPTPTAETAARVVGCTVGEIAETILLSIGQRTVAVLAAGDTRINSARIKRASGLSGKVRLLSADKVIATVGYPPGGVCPFLLPPEIPLYLDARLRHHATVYPAAGTPRSAVAVPVESLPAVTGGQWAEVAGMETGRCPPGFSPPECPDPPSRNAGGAGPDVRSVSSPRRRPGSGRISWPGRAPGRPA